MAGCIISVIFSVTVFIAASRRTNDLDGAGSTLYSIGLAYEGLNRFDRALASYEASLAIYWQLNSPPDMAVNLLNMGAIEYRTFARCDDALSHLQEALKIFRQINEEEFSALVGFHLGTLYVNTGQYRAAMGYLEDSLRTNRKLKSAEGIASVLHNMGRAHAGLGEYQRAIPLYEEAVSIDRKLNRFDDLAPRTSAASGMPTTTFTSTIRPSIITAKPSIWPADANFRAVRQPP